MSVAVICQGCGKRVEAAEDYRPNRIQCPECGVMCDLPRSRPRKAPAPAKQPAPPAPPPPPRVAVRAVTPNFDAPTIPVQKAPPVDDEDDGRPYQLEGGPIRVCPECKREIPPDAVLCTACGFDIREGKKVEKLYPPLVKHWEAGLTFHQRLAIFLACQVLALVALVGAIISDELGLGISSWLVMSAMLGFLLGTFDWVDLVRDPRGRVRLSKGWRVFFVARDLPPIRLSEYDGVVTGKDRSADFWDWFVLFTLLGFGIVPGVLWYYFAIHRDQFFAALSQHHGSPSLILYKGWKQEQAHEIANMVRDACGLHYRR